eukprot:2504761-Rhodomonas_salina.1
MSLAVDCALHPSALHANARCVSQPRRQDEQRDMRKHLKLAAAERKGRRMDTAAAKSNTIHHVPSTLRPGPAG